MAEKRGRSRSGKSFKKDPLGKLISSYRSTPTSPWVAFPVAVLLGVGGTVVLAKALTEWGPGAIAGAVALFALAAAVAWLGWPRASRNNLIEVRTEGIRWQQGETVQELWWAEVDYIEINTVYAAGGVKNNVVTQEVFIHSAADTMHLDNPLLRSLDDPHDLIKMIRRTCGKDIRTDTSGLFGGRDDD